MQYQEAVEDEYSEEIDDIDSQEIEIRDSIQQEQKTLKKQRTQNAMVTCNEHPKKPILYIYCKQTCPFKSRMICQTCWSLYKSNDGLVKIKDVLKDPRTILNQQDQSEKGIYNKLYDYFDLLEQDPDDFIELFKQGIIRQIEQLQKDLKEGIEKYKQFREEIVKVKCQFNEILGHTHFRQAFKDILKVKSYHYGPEWFKLEETIQNFIQQFKNQNNLILAAAYKRINEMDIEANSLQPKALSTFQRTTTKTVSLLSCQLMNLGIFREFSQLCQNPRYFPQLYQRMRNVRNIEPQLTLIFKASQDGMNSQAFWQKCANQASTIIFCRSKHGHVFGGYSPCQWVPNGQWQTDNAKTSFLFSYTRKEIYPLLTVGNSILGVSTEGPQFGVNLVIKADFQSGQGTLAGNMYSREFYFIENEQTHLMGGEKPEFVEMEVYRI